MKKYFSIIAIALGALAMAQVGVETITVRGSGIMDFKYPQTTGATKGLLLPKVATTPASPSSNGGALAFNVATQKVEVFNNANNQWMALTPAATGILNDAARTGFSETAAEGTIVATSNTDATESGVLVLDSTDHALILPTVATSADLPVVNANSAGMICYIEDTNTMAIFNGEVWSFWN
ncbi:MAG: hypothetical protein Q4G27_10280 [Flavobacteriaceae bacterium]|nr:hypothetical protein [Flavobacteriaceae bacterium]